MFFCSGVYKKYPKKTALYGGISWVLGMILNGVALQIGGNPKYRSLGIAIYYIVHIFLLGPFAGPLFVIGYFSYTKWCPKFHPTLIGLGSGCIGIIIAIWCQFIIWTATPIIVSGGPDSYTNIPYWFYSIGSVLCATLIFPAKFYCLPEDEGKQQSPADEAGEDEEKEGDSAVITYCLQYRDLLYVLFLHVLQRLYFLLPGAKLNFISTLLFSQEWCGLTLIVSPLLYLSRDANPGFWPQIDV